MPPRYFTAPDGTRYRVLDSTWRKGKWIYADPPAAWADTRVFNPESRNFRRSRIQGDPTQDPTDEQLAEELARSEPGKWPKLTLGERARLAAESED